MARNIIASMLLTLSVLTGGVLTAQSANAQLFDGAATEACKGAQLSNNSNINQECSKEAEKGVNKLIGTAVNILSVLIGIIAVFVLIISGLRFITSGGDASGISNARNGVIYAMVGLAIVAFAQLIVRFVGQKI